MSREWNSAAIIGKVEERFNMLERYKFEWRSFYIGWLEGRAALMADILAENPKP
jgi:hypothetical protein